MSKSKTYLLGICYLINAIYVKRINCNYITRYIKTTVSLRLILSSHITTYRLRASSNRFNNHAIRCMGNKKESYFQILVFMKLVYN